MISLVKNKTFGILISTKELDLYPLILTYFNSSPEKTRSIDNWNLLPISHKDNYLFSHKKNGIGCPIWKEGIDPCDRLLDHVRDDDYKIRYRNYMENPIVFQHYHPRNSFRSIVNSIGMFDRSNLYWYYITLEEHTILNRSKVIDSIVG